MKTIIYTLLLLLNVSFIYSQNLKSLEKDFNAFYVGNEIAKPIKYILFDGKECAHTKGENKEGTFYHINGDSFLYIKKRHKTDTLSIAILKKIKLQSSRRLHEEEVNYFMKKIEEYERKTNTKIPKSMPISRTHKYFKIYIFEKVNANKVIRREVEWQYATF